MSAQEIRLYRSMCKKLVETEERSKLLDELKKRHICLGSEEVFVQSLVKKFKVLGNKNETKSKCHDDIPSPALNPNPPGGGQICPTVFQTLIPLEPNVGLTSNQAVNSFF